MSNAASLGANCLASLFLDEMSVVEAHCAALEVIADAGFRLTEISQPGLLTLRAAATVLRHAEEAGIAVCAVHAPPMRRDPTLARQRHAALLAAALGARVLVVHVSSLRFADPDPTVRAQARDRDLHRLEALIAFCQPLAVAIGLENGKLPGHAEYLCSLLDTLGAGAEGEGGLVFDSGHAALRGGDPLAVVERLLPRLIHTHLHDNHGTRDDHLPPGDGRIQWQPLLDRLSAAHYTGALLIELHPRSVGDPTRWLKALSRGRKVLSPPADRTKGGGKTSV